MRHHVPRPGLQAAAFSVTPIETEYEKRLGKYTPIEMMLEFEAVAYAYWCDRSGANCERVRLCRREMARRLFRSAS